MKIFADLRGCYSPKAKAEVGNKFFDLQNSSYPT